MSAVLGKYLISLNIERLEISRPFLDVFDNSHFTSLYEAISKTELKYFSVTHVMIRWSPSLYGSSEFPLHGISMLSKSQVESFNLGYLGWPTGSTLLDLVRALPITLRELAVT